MSRYSEEKYEELRQKIRKILQLQPNISARKLGVILGIDYRVALRLTKKVRRERIEKIKRADVSDDISKIMELFEQASPEIAEIIFSKVTVGKGDKQKTKYQYSPKDRMNALKILIDGNKTVLNMKMDAGIFKRELGKLDIKGDLSPEKAALIEEALKKLYGKNADTTEQGDSEQGGEESVGE